MSWPTWTWSASSSYAAARLLGVRAGEHPVALAVGDERRLEVRGADRARIVGVLGELERALDVLARGLVVALAAPAARAPGEDVRAERVGRQARALGERERLVEEAERRLDAVQVVAADAEREEHLGPLDVGEVRCPRTIAARLVEQLERAAGSRRGASACGRRRRGRALRARAGPSRAPRGRATRTRPPPRRRGGLDQRLGAGERAFEPAALVGGDAVGEEAGVDAEPRRRASRSSRGVGRVLPRSICETYSFENRSPASSLWVSPAPTRSWRRRSPRRSPLATAGRLVRSAASRVVMAAGD